MKRHLATILIFLLLGAILNVAVAWGCVLKIEVFKSMLRIPEESRVHGDVQIRNERWYFSRSQSRLFFVGTGSRIDADSTQLPQYTIINSLMHGEPSRVYAQRSITDRKRAYLTFHSFVAWGWPNQSMWFRVYISRRPSRNQYYSGGLRLDQHPPWQFYRTHTFPRALPLYIIPVSFCLNTLFYAVILWLPYQGIFLLMRRWWRRRRIQRGLCWKCGYMVAPNLGVPRASPNCPECGTPTPEIGTLETIKSKA